VPRHGHVRRALRAWVLPLAASLACAGAGAAQTGTLPVSAVVLSKSNCSITGGGALSLDFGNIDPAATANATASLTTTIRCVGSAAQATYSFAADSGQHALGVGNRRMQHATVATEFLWYSLAISPASATIPKGATQVITITGTITPAQFQDVRAGSYSDRVAITLTP
jgi:spore coat protein U-like protein